ncbi:MAG: ABC transporter ATP-binding protein [Gammaproteobacteria bacterium]|nr:MAG: ABC transporter ATP-binding protein [Gammaproteobacteria bacterium]TND05536.1 MAG: ABC transporter, ATP-binding protein [Gammaproteobacteria bacterium]
MSELGENALPDIRRQYFGFVFQAFNLFGSLTALENVEVVLRMKGVDRVSRPRKPWPCSSALASRTGRDVLMLLRTLAEEAGQAVAIVSHDAKAQDAAHRVIVLEDGRVSS